MMISESLMESDFHPCPISPTYPYPTMSNIQELTTYAQDCAKQLGIDKFDIYGSTVEETSVEVDHGATKQVQASQGSSAIVRVWNAENQVGVTSTTDTDHSGIELALKTAKEASRFGLSENAPATADIKQFAFRNRGAFINPVGT